MASNLDREVRNISEKVTDPRSPTAHLSRKITVDNHGEILRATKRQAINTMVDQLRRFRRRGYARRAFAKSARQGRANSARSGPRARCRRPPGRTSPEPTSLNCDGGASNLDRPGAQHRRRRQPLVANGDLSNKITVDVRGEILELKRHARHDGRPARSFASEVTRVGARRSAPKASSAVRPEVPGVAGTWKDLTDNVNSMASNLTAQVRNIAEVHHAPSRTATSRCKITVDVQRRNPRAQEHHQHDGRPARTASPAEVTRVAREVGTEGKLGGQAIVPGVAGTWKDLDRLGQRDGVEPHAQVRNIAEVTTAVANGDLSQQDHGRRAGRNPRAEEHHQHDGRSAERLSPPK